MEENQVPLKKRRPATKTEIGRELKAIYENDEGGEPTDFKTFARAARPRRWPKVLAAVLILFVLAGVAWAGIMRFGGGARYGDDIELTIDGPAAPRAGEAGTWTIRYQNNERLPLAKAALTLNLPQSIAYLSSDPPLPDAKSLLWEIGTVGAGASGSVTIRGRTLDAVDAPIAMRASLSYRPSNFNADFQKVANWSSRIADAAVMATLAGPDEAVPGDDQTFALTVSRRADLSSDAVIPDLKIRFDPDQLIVIKNAVPAFSANDARTWIATAPTVLKPLTFTVTGGFATNTTGGQTVRASVGALAASGNFIVLAPTAAAVSVLPGDLVLTLFRNGSNADSTVGLGDAMHVSVDYENDSAKTITDAEIALTAAGTPSSGGVGPIDWSTLDDIRGGKRSGNTITWTKKEIPELGALAPKTKGSIDISFKTVPSVFTLDDRNYDVDLSVRGLIGSMNGKKSNKTVSTPVMRTLINSDARVNAAAALLPDSPSTYRVVLVISNSLHEINGIKATAQLPDGVTFAAKGNVDAGDLRYDEGSRSVVWTMDRLPTSFKSVSADFTVSVTPTASDAGKSLSLLDETMFTATDKATGGSLAGSTMALTTDLGT